MKALPMRFASTWRKAECDAEKDDSDNIIKEGTVEYLLEPINNRMKMQIGSENVKANGFEMRKGKKRIKYKIEIAGLTYASVSLALKGLRGLIDPETGKDLELIFEPITISSTEYQRVSYECLDRIPTELLNELAEQIGLMSTLSEEEKKEVNFTVTSSEPISTATIAPETETMKDDAPTTVPAEG